MNQGQPAGLSQYSPTQPLHVHDSETFYDPVEDGQNTPEAVALTEEEKKRQEEEWKQELLKTEEEIDTLRRVLASKLRHGQELKRKLGITVWQEVQTDLAEGVKAVKESSAVKKLNEAIVTVEDKLHDNPAFRKTSETLKSASDKSAAVLHSLAGETKKKMGELRNTAAFKSVEGAVTNAVTAVKSKATELATPGADRERTTFESELNRVHGTNGSTTITNTTSTTHA
ncbi:hypothetical protein RvY_14005 [Ramazzottius varieornatus]|uniref:Tumor protein D52 n=1 Tax=Ramazzottius varieornatus TaxID=947166 RepID=A0A1D1VYC3_RAMVA|nr:hypothetical protein RvY_14005 [Ramazzottius varieornatus]